MLQIDTHNINVDIINDRVKSASSIIGWISLVMIIGALIAVLIVLIKDINNWNVVDALWGVILLVILALNSVIQKINDYWDKDFPNFIGVFLHIYRKKLNEQYGEPVNEIKKLKEEVVLIEHRTSELTARMESLSVEG